MKGFTLIELMITVAIIGILAALAYPSYVEHIYRSRRAEAKATLMELAQWMERNYMLCSGYDKDCAGKGIDKDTLKTQIKGRSVLDYYNFTFVGDKPASNAFTLSATTTGTQVDDKCTVLTLTNAGVKCAYIDGGAKVDADGSCSTTKEVVEQCWR